MLTESGLYPELEQYAHGVDGWCTGVLCVVRVFWAKESKTPQGNLAKVYQKRLNQPIEIEIYATLPIVMLQNSIT